MATSFNDMQVLSVNPSFVSRVQMALTLFCTVVGSEAWTVAFHRERQTFAASVLSNPSLYAPLVAGIVAVNLTVANEATQNGTVALTPANVSAQQLLIVDGDISNAIAAQFNTFFRVPGS